MDKIIVLEESVWERYYRFLMEEKFADVTFIIQTEKRKGGIKLHKSIILSVESIFKDILLSQPDRNGFIINLSDDEHFEMFFYAIRLVYGARTIIRTEKLIKSNLFLLTMHKKCKLEVSAVNFDWIGKKPKDKLQTKIQLILNENLKKRFKRFLGEEKFTDCKFIVGTHENYIKTFKCHKFILASASEVFEKMFYGPLADKGDITVSDVQPEVFELFLQLIYCGEVENQSKYYIKQVTILADKYLIKIVDFGIIRDSRELVKNLPKLAIPLLQLALVKNDLELQYRALIAIISNTKEATNGVKKYLRVIDICKCVMFLKQFQPSLLPCESDNLLLSKSLSLLLKKCAKKYKNKN